MVTVIIACSFDPWLTKPDRRPSYITVQWLSCHEEDTSTVSFLSKFRASVFTFPPIASLTRNYDHSSQLSVYRYRRIRYF
jgi:hypothetical protein